MQSLAQYSVKGSRCEISHSTNGGFSRVHSSFEKFQIADISARECASSFSYQLDFLIVLPSEIPAVEGVAQRYKIEVVFEQDIIDDSDRKKLPYFLRDFFSLGSLRVDVEYTDYSVAQSLEAVVVSWTNQLPKRKESNLHKAATFLEPTVMKFGGAIASALVLAGGAWHLNQIDFDAKRSSSLILFCLSFATVMVPFIHRLCSSFYSALNKIAPCPTISLTQGDKDRLSKIGDINRRTKMFIGVILVSCVLSFVVSLLAAMTYDKVFA